MKAPASRMLMALASLWTSAALAQARITALDGAAVRVAGSVESPLKVGDTVAAGEQIRVEPDGRAEASLPDGSVVRLAGGTTLRVDDAAYEAGTRTLSFRARLVVGKVWSNVVKLVAGGKYEVETDSGVAGVRGTEFVVSSGEGTSAVEVYKGKVFFATAAQGSENGGVFVTRGQAVRVSGGALSRGPLSAEDDFARWVRERQKANPVSDERREEQRERRRQFRERLKDQHLLRK